MKPYKKSLSTVEKTCQECGSVFLVHKSTSKIRPCLYCSFACSVKNRKLLYGKQNPSWKGDDVGYGGLHQWVMKMLGTRKACDLCGRVDAKKYEWANKNHTYKRLVQDWMRMCTSCHRKNDFKYVYGTSEKLCTQCGKIYMCSRINEAVSKFCSLKCRSKYSYEIHTN